MFENISFRIMLNGEEQIRILYPPYRIENIRSLIGTITYKVEGEAPDEVIKLLEALYEQEAT